MKLKVKPRAIEKKREPNRIRRNGDIPAIIYSKGKEGETLCISGEDFHAALRSLKKGRLSSTTFTLVDDKGKERQAIVKDIQYHVTTYRILHIDFEELKSDVRVNVKVPIEYTDVMECAGIKLGGVLREVKRKIRVNCLPKDIPSFFQLSVKDMGIKQHKTFADLTIPETVRPVDKLKDVCVVIAKR